MCGVCEQALCSVRGGTVCGYVATLCVHPALEVRPSATFMYVNRPCVGSRVAQCVGTWPPGTVGMAMQMCDDTS
jgi:hypothetical protein